MKDNQLFPKRLKAARQMRGFSMDELSGRIQGLVSKQAISKYEQGRMMPNSKVMLALAKALRLPVDYFFRQGVEVEQIAFRTDGRLPSHSVDRLVGQAQDWMERYLILEDLLSIDFKFRNPLSRRVIATMDDVERAAQTLREKWMLGNRPIASVYEMLESVGVKLMEFESDNRSVLGFSTLVNRNIPLIVINLSANEKVERRRFTAFHELGHLLLDLDEKLSSQEKERFCHCFAGAMLCPATLFLSELGEHRSALTMQELISMKMRYGISVSAIVHRAKDLGVISETYYNQIYDRTISQNRKEDGWGDYPIPEHTDRFERLLQRAVAEDVVSISRAAELANVKLGDYRDKLWVV